MTKNPTVTSTAPHSIAGRRATTSVVHNTSPATYSNSHGHDNDAAACVCNQTATAYQTSTHKHNQPQPQPRPHTTIATGRR
eukprot:m.392328 g.392328  ORF g.392328 m.392328 type:complete len:81 (+) comp20084_c1_seq2:226-468(+)